MCQATIVPAQPHPTFLKIIGFTQLTQVTISDLSARRIGLASPRLQQAWLMLSMAPQSCYLACTAYTRTALPRCHGIANAEQREGHAARPLAPGSSTTT